MFNTLFKSIFNATTFKKDANKSIKSITLSLSDILSGKIQYKNDKFKLIP